MTGPFSLRIVRRARDEIREAIAWWDANRPKAPHALRDDLRRALRLLREKPDIGTVVNDPDLRGVRRLYLDRLGGWLREVAVLRGGLGSDDRGLA